MTKAVKIVIALIVVAIVILLASYHGNQFRKNHFMTTGVVIKCDHGGKGNFGPGIYYEYYIDNKWSGNGSRRAGELPYGIGKVILGKSFPVAYQKYWYGYEEAILITPRDFELYGHPFPDSLKWILPLMKK